MAADRPEIHTSLLASAKEMLTVTEVSEWLRVSPRTIYRLLSVREIPALRIGKKWRFNRQQVAQWIEQKTEACPRGLNNPAN
jgi:excisionase family DNA binding protein